MRIHTTTLKAGITPTPEFERKGLCSFAVNTGTKCGAGCCYCSTGALLRMHRSFRAANESPFGCGFAIVDPQTPERVARDAVAFRHRGRVQLCTTVDAWAPEAQTYALGRRCLQALLAQPGWTVRVLTKNAAVEHDFDLIQQHRDRVLVGLSLTASSSKAAAIEAVEPNASPLAQRMATMQKAHGLGLRTFGMLCPLLPGIGDDAQTVHQLVEFALACGVEEVFVEPVNGRGPGLKLTELALREGGFGAEADAVAEIRLQRGWSAYVTRLLNNVQRVLRSFGALEKLRFLLYPSRLSPGDRDRIGRHCEGVRWLGKDEKAPHLQTDATPPPRPRASRASRSGAKSSWRMA